MQIPLREDAEAVVRFGAFTLDVAARTLMHERDAVPLTPKELDFLIVLALARAGPVSKEHIIAQCWPGEAITDSAFFQAAYRLRRTLARFDPYGEYIRTVPGRGYQFAATVHAVDGPEKDVRALVDRLRNAITGGELRPGEALREEELSADFGASRIPIRRALAELETEGFVTFVPNRGPSVSLIKPDELRELFKIRALLEPSAMRWAAQDMTPEVQTKAEYAYKRMRSEQDPQTFFARHWQFREILYSSARMPRLTQIIRSLQIKVALIRDRANVLPQMVEVSEEHDALLLAACRKHDALAAERIVHDNITALEALLTQPW